MDITFFRVGSCFILIRLVTYDVILPSTWLYVCSWVYSRWRMCMVHVAMTHFNERECVAVEAAPIMTLRRLTLYNLTVFGHAFHCVSVGSGFLECGVRFLSNFLLYWEKDINTVYFFYFIPCIFYILLSTFLPYIPSWPSQESLELWCRIPTGSRSTACRGEDYYYID